MVFIGGKIKPATSKAAVYGDWNPNLVGLFSYFGWMRLNDDFKDFRCLDFVWNLLRDGRAHPPCHVSG